LDWNSVKALKVGETVEVTLTDGSQARGKIIQVTDSVLSIQEKRIRRDIFIDQVGSVGRKGQGMLLGGLIGLGGGLAVGLPLASLSNNEGGGSGPVVLIPAGIGVGLLVDSAFNRTHIIYDVPHPGEFRRLQSEAANGTPVVVTDAFGNVTRGKVRNVTSLALEVATKLDVVRFNQGDITLHRRKSGTLKGFVIGAAAGTGLGLLRSSRTRSAFNDPAQNALIAAGIGGGIGAALGKVFGRTELYVTYRSRTR
jgi:hypothetical protein